MTKLENLHKSCGKKAIDRGVSVYGDFTGVSFASVIKVGKDEFLVHCLEEPGVPEVALNRIFYDYRFACGICNQTEIHRDIRITLKLCPRSARRNMSFMEGPYWIKEGRTWRLLPLSAHTHGEDWINIQISVRPHQDILLASVPFLTDRQLRCELDEYTKRLEFTSIYRLGKTAEGRDICAIKTEFRDKRIVISASLQSAEFEAFVLLYLLDWLGCKTKKTESILKEYQFIIVPETMPDSVAHGYSIMNAVGQCPMLEFGKVAKGDPKASKEAWAIFNLLKETLPELWIDFHVHPGAYNSPKLNSVSSEFYKTIEDAKLVKNISDAILNLSEKWRHVPIPVDDPEFSFRESALVIAAEVLGIPSFCIQDYALTEEGKKAMAVEIIQTFLGAMTGV